MALPRKSPGLKGDLAVIAAPNVIPLDSQHSRVTQTPVWTVVEDPDAHGGSYLQSKTTDHELTFAFYGTALWIFCKFGPDAGIVNVEVDDESTPDIDLYSDIAMFKRVQIALGLEDIKHTVKITVSGTKNPSSSDCYVNVDLFSWRVSERRLELGAIEYIGLIDLINTINVIKKLGVIGLINLIDTIAKIETLERVDRIELIDRINAIGSIDKILKIVEIGEISGFGETGTLTYIDEVGTADILTPTAGYKTRVLGGVIYNETDIKAILRWKSSGAFVLGVPTLGVVGFHPFSLKHPMGATNEVLELYMSAAGVAKGWIVTDEVYGTGTPRTKTVSEILGLADSITKQHTEGGLGWVSPTSHEISPDWISPPLAYDGNIGTSARDFMDQGTGWYAYITLTREAITCNKVRFKIVIHNLAMENDLEGRRVQVDVYRDGGWVNVYDVTNFVELVWIEAAFAQGSVSKVRLRFYCPIELTANGRLYEMEMYKSA